MLIIRYLGFVNDILEGKNVNGIDEDTRNKIINATNDGKTIKTEVVKTNINESIISEDKNKINVALDSRAKIAQYFDISIILKANEQEIGKVTDLKNEIPIEIEIPNNLPKISDDYSRTYKIIRLHNENAEELEISNSKNGILTFKTNKFSTYALAYIDTKNEQILNSPTSTVENTSIIEESITTDQPKIQNEKKHEEVSTNPKTGDIIIRFVIIMLVAIIGIYIVYRLKKSDK